VKLVIPILIGSAFSVAMLIFVGFFLKIALADMLMLLSLSVAVVLAESAMGLYFAAKFADFRDVIRSRFVSAWGSLLGTLISLLLVGLTASPIFLSIAVRGSVADEYIVLSFAIGLAVFLVSWKLAERQMTKLFSEIRV
jgi:hypothetical protein